MVPLYQCEICCSKILETNLSKHHTKVHAGENFDIYTMLTGPPSKQLANNNVEPSPTKKEDISGWQIDPPKDETMVHIPCDICNNKMPAFVIEEHKKRKHLNSVDQVDAVGIMANAMTPKKHPMMTTSNFVNTNQQNVIQKSGGIFFKAQQPNLGTITPNDDFTISQRFKSALSFGTSKPYSFGISKPDSFSTSKPDSFGKSEPDSFGISKPDSFGTPQAMAPFYTVRVTEAQMQELLNKNRIYPKDGTFYLK